MAAWGLVGILAVVAAGCGDEGSTGTSRPITTVAVTSTTAPVVLSTTTEPAVSTTTTPTATTSTTTTTVPAEPAVGWIVALLDRIPATEGSGHEVELTNLTAAAQVVGAVTPAPGAPADEITSYLLFLPGDVWLPELLQRAGTSPDEVRAELGFDAATVQAAVTAGLPPEQFVVLQGDFAVAAIDAAVGSDPVWSDLLTTAEHGGVSYYAWGADFAVDVTRVTAARPIGRGGRLALEDGFLYWVPWTTGMEGLIDAGAGALPTLADQPLLRQAAEALEAQGVYSAVITDAPLAGGPGVSGALAPYLVLGLGGGQDDAGVFWVVVAIHGTAAAAEQSAAGLRTALAAGSMGSIGTLWSEAVTGADITVEGTALVAVIRTDRPAGDWVRAYLTRDPLLAVAKG